MNQLLLSINYTHDIIPGGGYLGYIFLGAGTAQKGGLRCGHNQKKGRLRHVYNPKKGEFRTDFVKERVLGTEVAQKGVLGAYLFIIFTFTCQYDQLVEVCSGRLKRGVLGAGTARKRGV